MTKTNIETIKAAILAEIKKAKIGIKGAGDEATHSYFYGLAAGLKKAAILLGATEADFLS